jgi:hypothetical protein
VRLNQNLHAYGTDLCGTPNYHISWTSPSSSPLNSCMWTRVQIRRNKFTDVAGGNTFLINGRLRGATSRKNVIFTVTSVDLKPHTGSECYCYFLQRNTNYTGTWCQVFKPKGVVLIVTLRGLVNHCRRFGGSKSTLTVPFTTNMAAERCSNTWIYSITLHGVAFVQDAARNTNRGRLPFGVPLNTPRSVLAGRGTVT